MKAEKSLFEEDLGNSQATIQSLKRATENMLSEMVGDRQRIPRSMEEAVHGVLKGKTYGVAVKTASANTLRNYKYVNDAGKEAVGVLGYWEGIGNKRTAYIPRADDIPDLVGYDDRKMVDSKGTLDYIRAHEILEASIDGAEDNHAEYEANLLGALKSLGEGGNERARSAYKAAVDLHERRDGNDPFGQQLAELYPIHSEAEKHRAGNYRGGYKLVA